MEQIKWSDEKVEQHLKNLPPIKDRRTKQEIFLKIQTNMRSKQDKGKRIPAWGIPAIATVCAIFLFGIFVPDLMKNDGKMDNAKMAKNADTGSVAMFENKADQSGGEMSLKSITTPIAYHSPMLAKDLADSNKDWVTVAYLDEQAQLVIPVSFETNAAHYVEKVQSQLTKFNPSTVGLSESPLHRAKITEEEETVIVDWPSGAIYEPEESLLKPLLAMTFANENQKAKVEFKTNGKKGYDFSLLGPIKEWDLAVPGAPHFRYDTTSKDSFIISLFSTGETNLPKSLDAALEVMDEEQERGLKPLLPKDTKLTVQKTGEHSVEITFPDTLKLSANNTNDIMLIDSILLTAESYGFNSVKFTNSGLDTIGPYSLKEPITDVIGTNFYHYQ